MKASKYLRIAVKAADEILEYAPKLSVTMRPNLIAIIRSACEEAYGAGYDAAQIHEPMARMKSRAATASEEYERGYRDGGFQACAAATEQGAFKDAGYRGNKFKPSWTTEQGASNQGTTLRPGTPFPQNRPTEELEPWPDPSPLPEDQQGAERAVIEAARRVCDVTSGGVVEELREALAALSPRPVSAAQEWTVLVQKVWTEQKVESIWDSTFHKSSIKPLPEFFQAVATH